MNLIICFDRCIYFLYSFAKDSIAKMEKQVSVLSSDIRELATESIHNNKMANETNNQILALKAKHEEEKDRFELDLGRVLVFLCLEHYFNGLSFFFKSKVIHFKLIVGVHLGVGCELCVADSSRASATPLLRCAGTPSPSGWCRCTWRAGSWPSSRLWTGRRPWSRRTPSDGIFRHLNTQHLFDRV